MLRLILILPLLLNTCQKDESISAYADTGAIYALQEFQGGPLAATIAFPERGTVRGGGPCNTYSASQTVPYPWIQLERFAATKRACPDLNIETAFFTALQSMTLVEVSGDVVILSNDTGEELVFHAIQD